MKHNIFFSVGSGFLALGFSALAQPMPQDAWMFSQKWGARGTLAGQFNYPTALAIGTNGNVYVADQNNHRIQVFSSAGTFLAQWGSTNQMISSMNGYFYLPAGIAVAPDGRIVVADTSNHRIQMFEANGAFVRKWGTYGSGDGQFLSPRAVAVASDGTVYVADSGNYRIQVFTAEGVFVRKWGSQGTVAGQFQGLQGVILTAEGRVAVADSGNRIQLFETDGTFVSRWGASGSLDGQLAGANSLALTKDGRFAIADSPARVQLFELDGSFVRKLGGSAGGTGDGLFATAPRGIAVGADGRIYVADSNNHRIQVFERANYRIPAHSGDIPLPRITRCELRPDAPYLDIDYVVDDQDSPTVTTALAAFSAGTTNFLNLSNFIGVRTFVDGTEAMVGSNIAANVTNHVCWNVAADVQTNYVNLRVCVMAKDERGLLAVDFITLPATESLGALTISRSPITYSDMTPLWLWLLATGEGSLTLFKGKVYGGENGTNGVLLAQLTTTTAAGRSNLFARVGVREATAAEVSRAKSGAGGVTNNQWSARFTVGPGDRPKAVNEYGFDTGVWSGGYWWVVRE